MLSLYSQVQHFSIERGSSYLLCDTRGENSAIVEENSVDKSSSYFELTTLLTFVRSSIYFTHMTTTPATSLNGYVCFYKDKRTEVYAATRLEARDKAAAFFKVKKAYDVTVVLAEKDGQPVVHSTASI